MFYHVALPVLSATGNQYFLVEADSPEKACELVDSGKGELDYEDIEVHVGKAYGAEPYRIEPKIK